jgi:hypothetical protein
MKAETNPVLVATNCDSGCSKVGTERRFQSKLRRLIRRFILSPEKFESSPLALNLSLHETRGDRVNFHSDSPGVEAVGVV